MEGTQFRDLAGLEFLEKTINEINYIAAVSLFNLRPWKLLLNPI
jgi:hypothetical protein